MVARTPVDPRTTMEADDLTQINGIKNGIEARLHAAGIHTYSQLAAMSPDEIFASLGNNLVGMKVEKIIQQKWVEQAQELARQKLQEAELPAASMEDRQHYVSLKVVFTLNQHNQVLRTSVQNAQDETGDSWAGWDPDRLNQHIIQAAGLKTDLPANEEKPAEAKEIDHPIEQEMPAAHIPREMGAPKLLLADFSLKSIMGERMPRLYQHNSPLEIAFTMNLRESQVALDTEAHCHAIVKAKDMLTGRYFIVAELNEMITVKDTVSLKLSSPGLPAGIYRIDAAAVLAPGKDNALPGQGMSAFIDGGPIRVN